MFDFVGGSTGVGSRGLCIGGRSVEVRNFSRRSDLGSLDSQQHNLIDYLNIRPLSIVILLQLNIEVLSIQRLLLSNRDGGSWYCVLR